MEQQLFTRKYERTKREKKMKVQISCFSLFRSFVMKIDFVSIVFVYLPQSAKQQQNFFMTFYLRLSASSAGCFSFMRRCLQ